MIKLSGHNTLANLDKTYIKSSIYGSEHDDASKYNPLPQIGNMRSEGQGGVCNAHNESMFFCGLLDCNKCQSAMQHILDNMLQSPHGAQWKHHMRALANKTKTNMCIC